MSGVSVDRLVILIAVVLVAAGGAFGWSKSGWGRAGERSATPAPAKFVQNADSRTAPDPSASSEGDEVPNSAFIPNNTTPKPNPAASTGGDEVPNAVAVAPAEPGTSSAIPQPAASSAGDESTQGSCRSRCSRGFAAKIKRSEPEAKRRRPTLRSHRPRRPPFHPVWLRRLSLRTRSRISCAACSRATKQGPRSSHFIQPAITRRCGSPTAKPMSAPRRQWPILPVSTPTVSIRPTIRYRISRSDRPGRHRRRRSQTKSRGCQLRAPRAGRTGSLDAG